MATIQKKTQVQNTQDFIRIQDLFYLCLAKWHWFVISLIVCLGVAVAYLLRTPPVYTRTASILIKESSNGKSATSEMEFSDLGMFTTKSNVNNEMGTFQSPDIMCEVVTRLHLDMNYLVDGRFHQNTIYGDQLPVAVTLADYSDNRSASFRLRLSADGSYTLTDLTADGESLPGEVRGRLGTTVQSAYGKLTVAPSKHYAKARRQTSMSPAPPSRRRSPMPPLASPLNRPTRSPTSSPSPSRT